MVGRIVRERSKGVWRNVLGMLVGVVGRRRLDELTWYKAYSERGRGRHLQRMDGEFFVPLTLVL